MNDTTLIETDVFNGFLALVLAWKAGRKWKNILVVQMVSAKA